MIYSYSSIERFRKCPRAFRFQYVDRVKVPYFETVEAFMGSRVHETLDFLYGGLSRGVVSSLDDLHSFFCSAWDSKIRPDITVNREDTSLADYRFMGLKCVSDYFARCGPFEAGRTLATEMRVDMDLCGDGRYRLMGFIDRLDVVDGVYEIHDYKTGRRLPSGGSWDRQLALYELGVRQRFDFAGDVDLVWHYLLHDREFRRRKSGDELESLKSEICTDIDIIESSRVSGEFPRKQSPLCNWCAFQELCGGEGSVKCLSQSRLDRFF